MANDTQFSSKSIGSAPEAIGMYGKAGVDTSKTYELQKEGEYTPEKIIRLIENFDNIHRALHDRMDADFDQYNLEKFELDIYSQSATYNEPKYMGDSIIQLCAASILNLTVNDEDEDKYKETAIEQFHLSMDKSSDEYNCQMLIGKKKPTLCFHGAIGGWMVQRNTIHRDSTGKLVPCQMALDPRHIKWGVGMGGFKWVAYVTWRTADEIYADYGVTTKTEFSRVIDFWSGKENVVLVDDRQVLRKPHNIGYPPFVILPCTNQPKKIGKDMGQAKKHLKGWGESVYASNREIWPILNRLLSLAMSEVDKAYHEGGVYTTDADQFDLEAVPYAAGQTIKAPADFKWAPKERSDVAKMTTDLVNIFMSAAQRGGVPWLNLGQLWKGQELSGNAIEGLKEGLGKLMVPILQTLEMVYQQSARMVEEQFLSYDTTWEASGYDMKGRHFFRAIEPDDISGNHEIKFEFLSITPQEEARNIAKAQLLKQSGLADDEFIDETVMKFQDPAGIEDRKLMQQAKVVSWKIAYLEMIKAYRKQGNNMYADILTGEMQQRLMAEQAQMQMGAQQPNNPQSQGQPQQSQQPRAALMQRPPAQILLPRSAQQPSVQSTIKPGG